VLADLVAGPIWVRLLVAGERTTREQVAKILAVVLP